MIIKINRAKEITDQIMLWATVDYEGLGTGLSRCHGVVLS